MLPSGSLPSAAAPSAHESERNPQPPSRSDDQAEELARMLEGRQPDRPA